MKTFKTVQEWLNSNPSKEEVARIVAIVNRKAISEARSDYYKKEQEFHKLSNYIKTTQKLGLEVPKDIEVKVSKMQVELEKIFKSLWPEGKKSRSKEPKEPKEPKVETKVEETSSEE
jgi:hypothetical protein